jgi:kinesin family protein 18/19
VNRSEAKEIRSALKRTSSSSSTNSAIRNHRRRSPTATSAGSPPSENMFSASHARRMVRTERDNEWKTSVLSPRTAPVTKAAVRRTTMGESVMRDGLAALRSGAVRVSSVTPGSAGRGSLAAGTKMVWR